MKTDLLKFINMKKTTEHLTTERIKPDLSNKLQINNIVEMPRFYKGFKVEVNNRLPHFRVLKNTRIIEFNARFFYSLSSPEKYYCLRWCINYYKLRDVFKSDEKTKIHFIKAGGDINVIYDLYRTMNMQGGKRFKAQRLYILLTEEYKGQNTTKIPFILSILNKLQKAIKEEIQNTLNTWKEKKK